MEAAASGAAGGRSGETTGVRMTNAADDVVTVPSPDGDVTELEPDGGAFVYTGACRQPPLVVTYDSGDQLTFDGPLCPGQELLVQDGSVSITAPSTGTSTLMVPAVAITGLAALTRTAALRRRRRNSSNW